MACLGVAVAATQSSAMSVTPVLVDLRAGGSQTSGQIRVLNTGGGQLPVELTAKLATVDANGEVTTTDAGADDLLIFPPQAVIPANGTQVFRLQWVGDPAIKQSKTFILSVSQQPVAMPQGVSGIQLLYDFEVVVNVAPLEGEPALSIVSADLVKDDKGERRAAVTVTNASDVHGYLSGTKLRLALLDGAGKEIWSKSWIPEEVAGKVGIGLVQPHATRRFVLPFDLPPGGEKLTAEIAYEGRR
jgi:fimbrial chaperone protein